MNNKVKCFLVWKNLYSKNWTTILLKSLENFVFWGLSSLPSLNLSNHKEITSSTTGKNFSPLHPFPQNINKNEILSQRLAFVIGRLKYCNSQVRLDKPRELFRSSKVRSQTLEGILKTLFLLNQTLGKPNDHGLHYPDKPSGCT